VYAESFFHWLATSESIRMVRFSPYRYVSYTTSQITQMDMRDKHMLYNIVRYRESPATPCKKNEVVACLKSRMAGCLTA
jgi:hypothetical protein